MGFATTFGIIRKVFPRHILLWNKSIRWNFFVARTQSSLVVGVSAVVRPLGGLVLRLDTLDPRSIQLECLGRFWEGAEKTGLSQENVGVPF